MLGKFFKKPSAENSDRVPPGQHLAKGFPVLTYGDTPQITTDNWQFRVWGLATPMTFTWSDFMALPHHQFTKDFHCVTRWSKLDVQWTGIKINDFMKLIEVDAKATHVMQHCYGDYTTNLSLEDFVREDNFFAFELLGNPLDAEHGGPMRSVIKNLGL
ncbi:MAG TPA: sulfite oxidase-like oxidoreductase, partial [Cyanothece sp. UBA12306]|nr:sulfite oxidase-like oxidoreductase [Cyanothece sp. UBA12306]